LDAIENAIRAAFERGNPEDRGYRVKVYRSAFAALERAIASSGDTRSEAADARRKALKIRIVEIEAEFLPAEGPAPRKPSAQANAPAVEPDLRREVGEEVRAPALDDAEPAAAPPGFEPRLEPGDYPEPGGSFDLAAPLPEDAPHGSRKGRPRRARRSLIKPLLVVVVILAAIGAGLWWADDTGLFLPETVADNPPGTLREEGSGQQGSASPTLGSSTAEENWITIFTPTDPTTVTAPAAGKAEVIDEEGGKFLRIRSGSGGSEFAFDVGQGVLEQIAGKHAVFDIVARAEDGKDTEISVDCNFGELGDCGRRRYAVGHEKNEYLFDVRFPDERPGAAGTIAIDSDFERQGRSVDIYEIRASVAE
jgi:hypothetical protein